ncbi:MAG TPA: polysaccharide biosynthesis tyrosine autokinase [Chthoniobacteraceae bacterium]
MAQPSKRAAESVPEIDFLALYYTLRSQAGWIILCVLIGAAIGATYLAVAPKIYHGNAVIQVEQSVRNVVNLEQNSENLQSLDSLKTLESNLVSWAVLTRVVRNPSLKLTPAALGLKPLPGRAYSEEQLIFKLASGVSAELIRGTRLITIRAKAIDPDIAGAVPSLIVEEYQKGEFAAHSTASAQANSFLIAEVERLRGNLLKSKQALQSYVEETKAVALEESRNITDARLRELNAKVTDAKTTRLKLESDYAQIKTLAGSPPETLLNVTSVATSSGVVEQRRNVANQEAEFARVTQRYKSKHPKYIEAQGQVEELRAGLRRSIILAAEGLSSALEAARATERKFEEALAEQEAKSLELGRMAIGYEALRRNVESDTTLYERVLTRLKETDVTKGIEPQLIRMIQPSLRPNTPSEPRKKLVLGASILGGALVGLFLAMLRWMIDRSLRTVDQAETVLDLPALGSVPNGGKKLDKQDQLCVVREAHGALAESFRTLRTSLSLLGPPAERSTFLFTSAVQGEGKSFCASNYAASLAQQGLRTLLIDADLRLPRIGKIFFDDPTLPGVADVLSSQTTLSSAVKATGIDQLFVLVAGNRTQHPAELLAGAGFGLLVAEAAKLFDRVVIDTAPVNAVSDTLLLVKTVQTVCLVVGAASTPQKAVLRARDKLREAGAPLGGIILNRLPSASGKNCYFHYAPGAYGEGVYGAPVKA